MTSTVVNSIPRGTVTGSRAAAAPGMSRVGLTLPLLYLYIVWFVLVTDVHRWMAERGLHITVMNQALTVMMIPLVILLVGRLPGVIGRKGRVIWYAPFLLFLLATMVSAHLSAAHPISLEYSLLPELPWAHVKILVMFYIVFVSATVLVNTPRRVVPLLVLFVGQFWWWGWHSGMTGAVWWHPTYANFDGFGPLVVIGLPVCLFFGLSAKSLWYRFGGFFLGGFCALAMVASFARGVILSGAVVAVVAVLRAPRKKRLRITAALLVGLASFMITSEVLHPGGGVWTEVNSAFTEGKDEGTGADRWELWTKALLVWRDNPVFGVGAGNTGLVAYFMLRDGQMEREGYYGEYIGRMWGRDLHNIWVQILAEFGLVGMTFVIWLLIDFWRRNSALRRPEFVEQWSRVTQGRFNLQLVALGLEGGMVAFVATGLFYNQLFENWFWSLLLLNLLLYTHAKPHRRRASPTALRPRRA